MDFVLSHTILARPPLVPEIELRIAAPSGPDSVSALWTATEAWLAERNVEPPFWAFAWAGGQALARHLLDHPNLVRGRVVLDVASGGGLVAIAAALAGASRVIALDVDPTAAIALRHNADHNRVTIEALTGRAEDYSDHADVLTAGDVFYDARMTATLFPWLQERAATSLVLVGDPGRNYRPMDLEILAEYQVPVDAGLEGTTIRNATVARIRGS